MAIPKEHWQTLKDILESIMGTRPRDEWLTLLRAADVPIDDPILGHTVQPDVSVTLNDTPGEIPGPAPMLESNGSAAALEALAVPRAESIGVSVRDLSEVRSPAL